MFLHVSGLFFDCSWSVSELFSIVLAQFLDVPGLFLDYCSWIVPGLSLDCSWIVPGWFPGLSLECSWSVEKGNQLQNELCFPVRAQSGLQATAPAGDPFNLGAAGRLAGWLAGFLWIVVVFVDLVS